MVLSLAIASVASACNIPVFRYALERWRPDQFEVIVFHNGDLTVEHQHLIETLGSQPTDKHHAANVKLARSDVSQPSALHAELWQHIKAEHDATLPYVVLRAKLGFGREVDAWHGPLDSVGLSIALDSPVRRELGRRLLAGHSIVWLMIRSDDEQQNQAARELLEQNLEPLSQKIKLPEGIGLPGSELHSEIPLLLKYSSLEVDRNDLQESFLVEMLSGFRPDAVAEGEPLIVPVFGRGRALEVIPASDLSGRLMEDLSLFLCGACSCQVKEQNPGFDLLLSVDWDTELFGEGIAPPAEKSVGDRQRPTLLTIPPGR
jgi:hypothetical protein